MTEKRELAIENEDGTQTRLDDIPCVDEPCLRCGKAPTGDGRWYSFVEREGKMIGVYICNSCHDAEERPAQ